MDLDDYQQQALRTAPQNRSTALKIENGVLGLCSESGELAGCWKAHRHHGHPFVPTDMLEELGDILWYIAQTADALGYPLHVIARNNLEKLERRYPNGFSPERSLNRGTDGTRTP